MMPAWRPVVGAVAALAIAASAAAQSAPPPEATTGVLLWQGMHFQWLRKIAGFETPHRMGTQAHYVTTDAVSEGDAAMRLRGGAAALAAAGAGWSMAGTFNTKFHPGVDGDYAHPALFYTPLYAGPPSSNAMQLWSGNVSMSWVDNSTLGAHPSADSVQQMSWSSFGAAGIHATTHDYEMVLAGYDVEMRCIDSGGPTCNSNGIWPSRFNVSLAVDASSGATVGGHAHVHITRGWTPAHGGGKPYNPRMQYNMTLLYTLIGVPKAASTASMQRMALAHSGSLFDAPASGTAALPAPAATVNPVVGLRGFGWSLSETGGQADLGRYLEEYHFEVGAASGGSASPAAFNWTMGLRSPAVTTWPSNVAYSLDVLVIADTSATGLQQAARATATGTVCEDDGVLFKCSGHHLPASLSDAVPLKASG